MDGRTPVSLLIATSLALVLIPAVVAHAAPPAVPAAASRGFPFGEPAYDSGWHDITAGGSVSLSHFLGGDASDYVVDVQGRDASGDGHAFYGGDRTSPTHRAGVFWTSLTFSGIVVSAAGDEASALQVRVRIWVVPSADYDSYWKPLDPGPHTLTLDHHLGGETDDYLVYLEMFAPADGINHIEYGRDRFRDGGDVLRHRGAYWYDLTGESIRVDRAGDSAHAESVRVRIWRAPASDYDSGWVSLGRGESKSLAHDLGGPWNDYVVDLQFKDTNSGWGLNQRSYGRDGFYTSGLPYTYGGYWHGLTSSQITLYRAANDNDAEQMRVRIWADSRAKYDSGWWSVSRNGYRLMGHDLGGDRDAYVVDLQFRDTDADGEHGAGVNQWNYGGDQEYASSLERYGAAWRQLTDEQITVYRWADDRRADEARVRIWIAPFADFDSGWRDIPPGGSSTIAHGAGVGAVYLEFNDAGSYGRNQMYYGMDRYRPTGTDSIEMGAYWGGLDSSGITVHRGADDTVADNQRVRIWRRPTPDYDSGWLDYGAPDGKILFHNLGLDTDGMVVEMQSRESGLVNQASYGSDTYFSAASWHDEGSFWANLTSNSVWVVREAQDLEASRIRVRIYLEAVMRAYLPVGMRGN